VFTSGLRALLLLAPAAFMSPALAATGADTRCDPAAESAGLPEAAVGSLTIEVVEHNASSQVTPGQLSVDGSVNDGGSGLEPDPRPPEVETLLRRIFDETQLGARGLPEPEDSDARAAPLANEKAETHDAPASESTDAEIDPAAAPRLPGVFGDDLVRFKRQMYRTDI
jgi:hypothetical protein